MPVHSCLRMVTPQSEGAARIIARAFAKLLVGNSRNSSGGYREEGKHISLPELRFPQCVTPFVRMSHVRVCWRPRVDYRRVLRFSRATIRILRVLHGIARTLHGNGTLRRFIRESSRFGVDGQTNFITFSRVRGDGGGRETRFE